MSMLSVASALYKRATAFAACRGETVPCPMDSGTKVVSRSCGKHKMVMMYLLMYLYVCRHWCVSAAITARLVAASTQGPS